MKEKEFNVVLTTAERDSIIEALGDNISEALSKKLNVYIPIMDHVFEEVFILRWVKPSDDIFDWKIKTTKVDYVDDYDKCNYGCWINRQHHLVKKTDVFLHRLDAQIYGHKQLLTKLEAVIDCDKDIVDWAEEYKVVSNNDKYLKAIKDVKRKIYLMEITKSKEKEEFNV